MTHFWYFRKFLPERHGERCRNVTAARRFLKQLVAERTTINSLREAVPKGYKWCADCEKMTVPEAEDPDFCGVCGGEDYWVLGPCAVQAILYPPETDT